MRRPVRRGVCTLAAAGFLYYLVPLRLMRTAGEWAQAGGAVLLLAVLAAMFRRQLLRQVRAAERGSAHLETLINLLVVTVLAFSLVYVLLANHQGQFTGLATRTDALYFTLSTLATVGYGDVHPVGQAARIAVIVQIVFNLVYVGAAVTVLGGAVRRRVGSTGAGPGGEADRGTQRGDGSG
ncbi:potassium channel family protein [Dactylosporangium sp. NPDC000521]|uniref:potassium channel family protein n=1 Tax=Dactylosporangium sp. NPDC000521 TaxID=3363975 RepID=UPI0036A76310